MSQTVRQLGIVDLGSNTARLVVYSFEPGKWFRLADQLREPVRLGEGLGRDGNLTSKAQSRAETALRLFMAYSRSTGIEELEVLATSALRDSMNQAEFLGRVEPLGLNLKILAGEEEARLGVLAAANGFEFEDAWIMDLGGGSAQISLMRQREFVRGRAYPLGGVRLTEQYFASDPPKSKEIKELEDNLDVTLSGVVERMRAEQLPLIAMGGTIRNLARAIQKRNHYPLIERLHGFFLEASALEEITAELLDMKSRKRSRVPGIKADRADVIAAGAVVYRWLVRACELDGIWISGDGMREGALMRHFLEPPYLIPNLRSFSVGNLLQHYAQSKGYVAQTRHLAGRLFLGLQPIHCFGEREGDLLDAATVLQDIGLAVNYYRHDKHGEYLVSAARLNGFTHREQALLALLVRYHLRGRPRQGVYEPICRPGDKRLLNTLAACLRIADHLERPRAGCVRDVQVEISEDEVVLKPIADGDPILELLGMTDHESIFETAFNRRLIIGTSEPDQSRSGSASSVTES